MMGRHNVDLQMEIELGLRECIELPDEACYKSVAYFITLVIYTKIKEDGGIWEPTEGGWYEWMMRQNFRPTATSEAEKEKLDEVLAIGFMNDDIDGLTDQLLNILGLEAPNEKP